VCLIGYACVTKGLCRICRNDLCQKSAQGIESNRGKSVMRQSVVLQSVNVTPIISYVLDTIGLRAFND